MTYLILAKEQIVLPSSGSGIDWGVQRRVLLVNGKRFLALVPGHTSWSGRGSPRRYVSATYRVFGARADHQLDFGVVVWEGRFTQKKIEGVIGNIAGALKVLERDVRHVNPKETYIVCELR